MYPRDIISDRGLQFTAKFLAEFCSLLSVYVTLSPGFHLQTNRQTGQLNQGLWLVSACTVPVIDLVWVDYAHNFFLSAATGLTPIHTVYS